MVTLDIQDTGIRAVVFQGKKIKTVAVTVLEPGLVKDGLILDPATVSRMIRDLFEINGITEKQVIASITGIHSVYRLGTLPLLKGSFMEEAVLHEMVRSMPVPLDQVYTAWQAIPISKNEATVPMIGLPRSTVDALITTLKLAGLSCKDIDLKPMAAARVIEDSDALVINILPGSFNIIIVIGGIPDLIRSLPFPDNSAPPINKINILKEELDRTINFYNSEHPQKRITSGIAVYISGIYKEIMVEKMGSPPNLKPLPQVFSYPEGFNASEFIVNLGLALKQARAGASPLITNINFLPASSLPKPIPVMRIAAVILIIVGIVIIALQAMNTMSSLAATAELQAKLDKLGEAIKGAQAEQPEIIKLQEQLKKIKTQQDVILQMQSDVKLQRKETSDKLAQITSLLPGTINLVSLSYNSTGNTWTVTGNTTGSAIIINYVSALQASGKFTSVVISSMQEIEVRKWNFSISIK